jgi:hypothetical protein
MSTKRYKIFELDHENIFACDLSSLPKEPLLRTYAEGGLRGWSDIPSHETNVPPSSAKILKWDVNRHGWFHTKD